MEFNEDELKPASWMTEEFFDKLIKHIHPNSKLINFEASPATAKGDHFASVMYRIAIRYMDKNKNKNEISVVMKTMPEEDGLKKDLLQETHIFETEIRMYRDIIPAFEKMLRAVGDQTSLGAKMLYYALTPHKVIVFEDITKKDFITLGKRLSSYEEAKLSYEKLAKWHACSYKYNVDTNGGLEDFHEGCLTLKDFQKNEFFLGGLSQVIKIIKKFPELNLMDCVPKLEKIQKTFYEELFQLYDQCNSVKGIHVLNHGDFHAKNMMYKYDEDKKVVDVTLVDFQLCVWSTNAIDLTYSKFMLMSFDTVKNYFDEFLKFYFDTFTKTLKQLNFTGIIPSYENFQKEFLKINHWELFLMTTFRPFMVGTENENLQLDPNDLIDSTDARVVLYEQEHYLKELKELLPKMLAKWN